MIAALDADRPAIEAFLKQHIATSMFPLSNLRRFGMAGGHARAMRFWLRWQAGWLTDVLGVSQEGIVFPQCPTGCWGDAKVILQGRNVKGILGDATQVAGLRAVLALSGDPGLDEIEPLYALSLNDLVVPDVTGFRLVPLEDAPRKLVVGWRRAYLQEVMPMPGEDLAMTAVKDIVGYISADTHRVLYDGTTPVAMTGFNAVLPEAVQIGGVYTPPALRGRGQARRAVALHLAQARASGVETASLFAASPQACTAYEAIGFRRMGDFRILIYQAPQVIYG
ncbi:GNAT family acetyltransferase [Loktanella sp. 5RATIMAR09]|uniref:GNAT family N-acetyltransferase n=1 Tax=Loktanella sp. 5RATIMAR09 TaxID=1225655 RepID=UPI0006EB9057|nr:GNAT family N-acetyltransferase [Loktanella sp. 5RATIMAR09]KQI71593.1 GNAT family acetyltransferase [Loktanella sp. 5RATIMAR09]